MSRKEKHEEGLGDERLGQSPRKKIRGDFRKYRRGISRIKESSDGYNSSSNLEWTEEDWGLYLRTRQISRTIVSKNFAEPSRTRSRCFGKKLYRRRSYIGFHCRVKASFGTRLCFLRHEIHGLLSDEYNDDGDSILEHPNAGIGKHVDEGKVEGRGLFRAQRQEQIREVDSVGLG